MKYYDDQLRRWEELTEWMPVLDTMRDDEALVKVGDYWQMQWRSVLPPEPGPLEILDELVRKSEWLLAKFRG